MFRLRMGKIFEGQSVDKEVILVSLKNLIYPCCVFALSCLTFCYPMGFPRQEYWSGLLFPPLGHLPEPEIKPAPPPLLLCGRSVMSNFLQPYGLQDSRLPCPLPSPGVCSNSCPLSQLMPSNHLILYHLILLLPLIFPSIMVFSKDSALCIRWPKYWSFSFSTSPSNEYSRLISFRIDWCDLLAIQGTLKSLLQHQSRWILYCWDTREALLTPRALSSVLAYLYLQFCTPFRDSVIAQLVKNPPSVRETLARFLGWRRSPGEGIGYPLQYSWASLVAQLVKNLPAMGETWVQSLVWENPLEKGKATHSSILAWRIQSMGSQRSCQTHNWATCTFTSL